MIDIETRRLRLARWRHSDFGSLWPIARDPEVMRFITGGEMWSDAQIGEFIRRQMRHAARRGFCLWRITRRHDGKMIGLCGLQPVELEGRREVEIGWWLARHSWRRGIATEAARAGMRFAFAKAGLRRVIAIAIGENAASLHVMRKIGMRFERDAMHKGVTVVVFALNHRPPA
jgi:[ribosomal protein S5]-alanine N-acetyltransferase